MVWGAHMPNMPGGRKFFNILLLQKGHSFDKTCLLDKVLQFWFLKVVTLGISANGTCGLDFAFFLVHT